MSTMEKIRNTVKSFDGRIKALEKDPDVDLARYCDLTSALEHECFEAIKRILEKDEKDKNTEISSVELAARFGLIDNKD